MRLINYALGNYISTSGDRGSTMIYGTVRASSNSSGACASSDEVYVDFAAPDNPKLVYQALLYNPSTYTVDVRYYTYEPSLSTIATDAYMLLGSTSIPPSTEQYTPGLTYDEMSGVFNRTNLRIGFNANTTGTSNSTDVLYRVAIKEWY
ncbi:MAG: hypothetical protein JRI72_00095 [Deltaproteobacteria bacterium]|nr:hypothetical protein [Deltaproteobacteria bacterium]